MLKYKYLILFLSLFVLVSWQQKINVNKEATTTFKTNRLISSISLPSDFDWSKLTYVKHYKTDPNTKEKREIFYDTLKAKSTVPKSIRRMELKKCDQFTEPEKLFAYGVVNKTTGVVGYDTLSLVISFDKYYREHKSEPADVSYLPEFSFLKNPNELAKFYKLLEQSPELIGGCFSPITKRIITFNNEQFTPGQMYIKRITDQEYLSKYGKPYNPGTSMKAYVAERNKGFNTRNMHIYYYRLYGEDSAIAEGIINLSSVQY